MRTYKAKSALLAATAAMAITTSITLRAGDTNAAPERIGIYDSRVVAYAHFSSEANLRKIREGVKAAKEAAQQAEASGQTEKINELKAGFRKGQEQIHLQVFGSAPVDDVLSELHDRLPAIQTEAGVSMLISKWDKAALKRHPKAVLVDVTDLLAREFKPGEKQLKVIAEIKRKKPAPLDELKNMKDKD